MKQYRFIVYFIVRIRRGNLIPSKQLCHLIQLCSSAVASLNHGIDSKFMYVLGASIRRSPQCFAS